MTEVKFISSKETHPLRYAVLWQHRESVDTCTIDVDNNKNTFHVGIFHDNLLVSIGTFIVDKNTIFKATRQYRLRAMATLPDFRGNNYGKEVIDFALKELKKRNTELLWCNAREIAIGFYQKLSFKIKGDFFDIPNIGKHKVMYIEL